MNILRQLFLTALIIAGGSLVAFAQKKDEKPKKGDPPVIVVKPKDNEKPKGDKPNNGKKPQGAAFDVLNTFRLEEE